LRLCLADGFFLAFFLAIDGASQIRSCLPTQA
jgi:hypothetical protein